MSNLVGNPEDRFSRVEAHLDVMFPPVFCDTSVTEVEGGQLVDLSFTGDTVK